MENILYSIAGIFIPFLGTTLGATFVFFMKKEMSDKVKKIIIGFASGVMIAASIWSLILPSIEMAQNQGIIPCVPAAVGFCLGIIFLIVINKITMKLEKNDSKNKLDMLIFSVTLHNVPEGMAVRSLFCRIFSRKYWNCTDGSYYFKHRNSYSKYSRRSNNFNAFENEGNE